MSKVIEQAQIVSQAAVNPSQEVTQLALFDIDGDPYTGGVSAATTTVAGVVKQSAAQANTTASDVAGLVTDFNALLAKLRTAGIVSN